MMTSKSVGWKLTSTSQFSSQVAAVRATSDRYADNVSAVDSSANLACYVSLDGLSGFAVSASGELAHVWSLVPGRGDVIVSAGVNRGALWLSCFDGYLSTLYVRHGFKTVSREANWTPGEPDVLTMSRKDSLS